MRARTRTWFSFVVAISVLFVIASQFSIFDPLDSAVLVVAQPIESGLRGATQPLADLVNNVTDAGRLSDENQALRQENERLTASNARLQASETELNQLRQLQNIRIAKPNDSFVEANVFAQDAGNSKDLIAIDAGSSDGLKDGMVVLTRQGSLIGTVTKVLNNSAWVTLITDPSSAVSALVQESRTQGVAAGSVNGDLTMEFVSETADVKEGDLVLTSGIGGGYPPDELIGQVVGVDKAAQELFQSVHIKPLADLSRLEGVLVLTSFVPKDAS
jgi:rod shape-determining protein MreC